MSRNIKRLTTVFVTLFLLFTFGVSPSQAAPLSSTVQSSLKIADVPVADPLSSHAYPGKVIRTCGSGQFGFGNFGQLSNYLSKSRGWYLNKNRVWQSPNDTATWSAFCTITDGKARMYQTVGGLVISHSPTKLGDGTRIDFRPTSSSGGYTIDINNNGTQYKVHRVK